MSDLGTVTAYDAGDDGATVRIAINTAEDPEADWYAPPGLDAPPLPGDVAVAVEITDGTGELAGVGVAPSSPKAAPGEFRFVARTPAGVACEVWLRADGSVSATVDPDGLAPVAFELAADGSATLANYIGSMALGADGTLHLNGVTIDPLGNLSATSVRSALVGLDTHTHAQTVPPGPPVVPTTPPTPGT